MTLNELKVLLALNGNSRIEYAEDDIFKKKALTDYYLRSIVPEVGHSHASRIFIYCTSAKPPFRWPEAEHIVAKSPKFAYMYAANIIEGRWPEGEAAIATDAEYAVKYAQFVLKQRFLAGEHIIGRDKQGYRLIYYHWLDTII